MDNKKLILLILLTGLLLRLYHLDAQSFFYDEAVQYDIANKSLSYIASMAYVDERIPPGTFLPLHFWLMIDKSDFFVRLLFALIGVANIWVIYLLGRELINDRVGILSALLMAINPFHIWYSQDARPYVFLMLFCTLHVWFFLRCISRGHWKDWLGFSLCAAAALYSHPFAAFTLGLEFCYAICAVHTRRFWTAYLLTGGLALTCFLPYVFTKIMLLAGGSIGAFPKPISWIVMPFACYTWFFGFSVGPSLAELHWHAAASDYLHYLPWMLPTLLALGIIAWEQVLNFIGDKGYAIKNIMGWYTTKNIILLLWMLIPVFAVFLISKIPNGAFTFNVRYCSESFIPFILLLACGIESLFSCRVRAITVLSLLLLGSSISLGRVYFIEKYWKEDVRSAGHLLNHKAMATDLILVLDNYTFQHYYKGIARVQSIFGAFDGHGNTSIKPDQAKQIWLVYYREWALDPDFRAKLWLDTHWKPAGKYSFPNCTVFCYQQQ